MPFFLGPLTDRIRKDECNPDKIQLVARNVALLKFLRHENTSQYWNKTDPVNIKGMVISSKALETSVLGKYQPSGIGTQKWHFLDHAFEQLRRVAGIPFFTVAFHECSQNIKISTLKSSKQRKFIMNIAMNRYNVQLDN